jgi:hypothetical protein
VRRIQIGKQCQKLSEPGHFVFGNTVEAEPALADLFDLFMPGSRPLVLALEPLDLFEDFRMPQLAEHGEEILFFIGGVVGR